LWFVKVARALRECRFGTTAMGPLETCPELLTDEDRKSAAQRQNGACDRQSSSHPGGQSGATNSAFFHQR
jgi:hypothetical protein